MECYNLPENGSLIRAFHAVPNAPAVDVYVNGNPTFRNLSFREFTNYVPLPAGTYTVTLYAAGTTAPALINAEVTVPLGAIFTAAATGNIDDLQLLILEDSDADGTNPEVSKVRAIHLAPNAPGVNLSLDGMIFVEDIRFREMTPFTSLPEGSYTITVLNNANTDSLLSFRIRLANGLISTIYIIGDLPQLEVLHSIDGSSYLCP